ncbi:hypothetical protein CYMTET_45648 [Cymbomonas tetramitiformis]|uniref:Uncharacterized protein n=1 Tax=Cymbomonas tetramitiformis TaxID=36881 RepID=A0AAE0EY28_9CHLO|nr:hypothetical protein CYMTET_47085 [Cymbomonas tetramitiformis]KAK3244754.1 hypothetical protein CYMTET_45648 [Cymbomonas tetramitiformis]
MKFDEDEIVHVWDSDRDSSEANSIPAGMFKHDVVARLEGRMAPAPSEQVIFDNRNISEEKEVPFDVAADRGAQPNESRHLETDEAVAKTKGEQTYETCLDGNTLFKVKTPVHNAQNQFSAEKESSRKKSVG